MAENFGRAIDRNKNGIIQAVVSRTQEKANSFSKSTLIASHIVICWNL